MGQAENKVASFDEEATSKEVIKLREKFQYGTETILDNAVVKKLVNEAKELIETAKLDLKQ